LGWRSQRPRTINNITKAINDAEVARRVDMTLTTAARSVN
jgi:hypothetical protein